MSDAATSSWPALRERLHRHAGRVMTDPQHHLLSERLSPVEASLIVEALDEWKSTVSGLCVYQEASIAALEAQVARLTAPVTEEDVREFKRSYLVNVGISDDPDGAALTAFLERRMKG
jgi:hypothetical protein